MRKQVFAETKKMHPILHSSTRAFEERRHARKSQQCALQERKCWR